MGESPTILPHENLQIAQQGTVAPDASSVFRLNQLSSRSDVADALRVPDAHLCKILYGLKLTNRYRKFFIPKKRGGKRMIEAPPFALARLQSRLARLLLDAFKPKPSTHGFLLGRSVLTNAQSHVGRRWILNIDLSNFFPSIHFGRVRGAFSSSPYNVGEPAATILAQICCCNGRVPQGAPTSPIVSNIICRSMDNALQKLAEECASTYSRYADDITFSMTKVKPNRKLVILRDEQTPIVGPVLRNVIEKQDFEINEEKVRCFQSNQRQEVTGLTVNEFANIPRRFVRQIRAMLHAWQQYGLEGAQQEHNSTYCSSAGARRGATKSFASVVKGKLDYLKMIRGEHDPVYQRLYRTWHVLSSSTKRFPLRVADLDPTPLRGRKRHAASWDTWFSKYKHSIYLLETEDQGKTACGTAFKIPKDRIVTAAHCLEPEHASIYIGSKTLSVQELIPPYRPSEVDITFVSVDLQDVPKSLPIPTQWRLPQLGEEVAAIGFPAIAEREVTSVMRLGTVEALPVDYKTKIKYIQMNFAITCGFSGAPLIDKAGFVIGVVVGNAFWKPEDDKSPPSQFGQVLPVGYLHDDLCTNAIRRAQRSESINDSGSKEEHGASRGQ